MVGGVVGCRWGREGARPQVKPVGFCRVGKDLICSCLFDTASNDLI